MTLLILAAGMGSRFGGLKQMEPIGPNGEFIIDYSIYDARKAGFKKIIFVIKEEMYEEFKATIGKRIEGQIEVEYVFQKIDDIPSDKKFDRIKPWGTGQAILCAKDKIDGNFAVINADDFYGRSAFVSAYDFLIKHEGSEFGLVGYRAINTVTENGTVKRGVCNIENKKLVGINESIIERRGDVIHCHSLINDEDYEIDFNHKISMSLFLFTPKLFELLENDFREFFDNMKDEEKAEFLITEVLDKYIKNGEITVEVIDTDSIWYGVTYKEDKEDVVKAISSMIDEGIYNSNLWNNM